MREVEFCRSTKFSMYEYYCSSILNSGGFEILDKYPALVRYYSGAAGCGCVFVHKLQGKVTTAQVDTRTVYQKKYPSTGIPCTAVRGGYLV
jgi:hypothetical protein